MFFFFLFACELWTRGFFIIDLDRFFWRQKKKTAQNSLFLKKIFFIKKSKGLHYTMQWFSFLFEKISSISTHTEYDVSLPFVFAFFIYYTLLWFLLTDTYRMWCFSSFCFFLYLYNISWRFLLTQTEYDFSLLFQFSIFYIIHIIIIFTVTYRI